MIIADSKSFPGTFLQEAVRVLQEEMVTFVAPVDTEELGVWRSTSRHVGSWSGKGFTRTSG